MRRCVVVHTEHPQRLKLDRAEWAETTELGEYGPKAASPERVIGGALWLSVCVAPHH